MNHSAYCFSLSYERKSSGNIFNAGIRCILSYASHFPDSICHLGYYFKRITYNAIIGSFKKWSFRIFINYYDDLAPVYSGKVLNGAGNANRNVQIRSNSETGLSHVFIMRSPMRISDRSAAGSSGM